MEKRILVFTNHYFPENFKINELTQKLSENYIVHVVTGLPNYPDGKIYQEYGFFSKSFEKISNNLSVIRLPLIPRGSGSKFMIILNYLTFFISSFFYTTFLLFKKKYDLVFVHHTTPIFICFPAIIYKKIKKCRLILWDLDMWPDTLVAMDIIKSNLIISYVELIVKFIYKSCDHILLGSKHFFENAEKRISKNKISYFPNWAEENIVRNQIINLKNYQFPENGLNIMYAGNIGEAQDFDSLINCIYKLRNKNINWLFVGDGRKRKSLIKKLSKKKLTKKVFFYGNQSLKNIPFFYSKADVMYLSLKDKHVFKNTVPAKLQSYMAAKKPIIAMISGEANKIIKTANAGWVADSGNYNELSKLILEIIEIDKNELIKIGLNSFNYYKKHFSWENRVYQIQKLIQSL